MTEQKKIEELKGLNSSQVLERKLRYGDNKLIPDKKENLFLKLLEVLKEPMFLFLTIAAIIYFILGEPRDAVIMIIFVIGMVGIDVIQEWKTDKTLNALKNLSAPNITVIRDRKETVIKSYDLLPGDLMIITEGVKVPADGKILKLNDLCIDESSLTGESKVIWKRDYDDENNKEHWKRNYCYAGTLVIQGSATVLVEKIGAETEYGKIGTNVVEAPEKPTPMQKQIRKLIKVCGIIAVGLCAAVFIISYLNFSYLPFVDRVIESILSSVTLAMAMIPEEILVILTVFLSMGAWRIARKKAVVRKVSSVETLGEVSVLCVDKTGTITMNKMSVSQTWALNYDIKELIRVMGMACETDAYDPMEQAMLKYCEELNITKNELFSGELVTEYSFTTERKMMGHVWDREGEGIIVAAKGSPEKILTLCSLSDSERKEIEEKIFEISSNGNRVIAVGKMMIDSKEEVPSNIYDCKLEFLGLIGLQDPPREGIKKDIKNCLNAGIRVVMITGDNGITASSIAKQVGIPHSKSIITGDELSNMSDEELKSKVKDVSIFSRVIPEHKMRIVKALKENGEIVAMTGDGVNDAPALKYADIGIAMGKRGSEVSREAADLVLLDDNFSTIINTIRDGRRIYDNIRKAIGYAITIHLPIALSSLIAPLLGINARFLLLLPVHVVLLELIIDPTCSIVLERQPAEDDIMVRKPRNPKESIVNSKLIIKSIVQGVILFAAAFIVYYIELKVNNVSDNIARSMGLSILILSNIFLVQVNSSDKDFAYRSMMKLKKDPVMWGVGIITVLGLGLILYTPIAGFLNLAPLSFCRLLIVVVVSITSIMWYELVKLYKLIKRKQMIK